MHDTRLPHHKLHAFGVAMRLLEAVRAAGIRDSHLRDQAMRAAKSAALNASEGAGRVTRADKARAFTIARGEACEAVRSQTGESPGERDRVLDRNVIVLHDDALDEELDETPSAIEIEGVNPCADRCSERHQIVAELV